MGCHLVETLWRTLIKEFHYDHRFSLRQAELCKDLYAAACDPKRESSEYAFGMDRSVLHLGHSCLHFSSNALKEHLDVFEDLIGTRNTVCGLA